MRKLILLVLLNLLALLIVTAKADEFNYGYYNSLDYYTNYVETCLKTPAVLIPTEFNPICYGYSSPISYAEDQAQARFGNNVFLRYLFEKLIIQPLFEDESDWWGYHYPYAWYHGYWGNNYWNWDWHQKQFRAPANYWPGNEAPPQFQNN